MNDFIIRSVNMEATGDRISELRRLHELTVEKLAEYVGTSLQAVYKWQAGKTLPTLDNILILCDIFQVHVEDIVVRNGDRSFFICGRKIIL